MDDQETREVQTDEQLRLTEAFKDAGEAVKENMRKAMVLRSWRYQLAKSGFPVKPGDLEIKLNEHEWKTVQGQREKYENYQLPAVRDVSELVGGLLEPKPEAINGVRMALATRPIGQREIQGERFSLVRDLRDHPFQLTTSESQRIAIATQDSNFKGVSYDPEKLLLSLAADSQDPKGDYSVIPYPHLNNKREVEDVTVLILNGDQREGLKQAILSNPRIQTTLRSGGK